MKTLEMINQCPDIRIHPLIEETIANISHNWEKVLNECENLRKNSPVLEVTRKYAWETSQPKEGWVYSWNQSRDWLNYGLISNYKVIDANKETCKETMNLLQSLYAAGFVKVAGFSRMLPNCHLKTHKHENYERVTWHLGLIIPDSEKCVLTVNNIQYKQKEGQWIRFNDSQNHSSTNFTDKERIILYLKLKEL